MNQEEVVLCGSSAYTKKYYLNPDFQKIPQGIQDELKLMCVLYTEDVGGTLTLNLMRTEIWSLRQRQMKGICCTTRLEVF